MNEHKAARKLSTALKTASAYVWKINANFTGGVPDFWIAGKDSDLWLELKWINKLPVRDDTRIVPALSDQQRLWLTERALQGVRVSVLLASPEGWLFFDQPDEWREGIAVSRARAELLQFTEVVAALCRRLGISGGLRYGPLHTPAIDGGANLARQTPEVPLAAAQGSVRPHTGQSRRSNRPDARRLHAVPQPAHTREHGLRARLVPAA